MKDMLDSYEVFSKKFGISKNDFFSFGIENTILPPLDKVESNWDDLKKRVYGGEQVTIRGYGRDANGTNLYIDLYQYVWNNFNVIRDRTNNLVPQKIIEVLTGYSRNKNIRNYQVSHIFGRTKNILLFEAPWNIALVPKIIDPLTGHESTGEWPDEYKDQFMGFIRDKYKDFIQDYNGLITNENTVNRIQEYLIEVQGEAKVRFEKDVLEELSPL